MIKIFSGQPIRASLITKKRKKKHPFKIKSKIDREYDCMIKGEKMFLLIV